ncbi:MAG TPA: hypothetical protein VFN31_03820 [Candidatus Saccharimonadales bacterium]|nr:hypothetical protein [Candidatus Saccharimonadales bacterium]
MNFSMMATSASSVMSSYVSPMINSLCVFAGLLCLGFLVNAGFQYTTSSGNPEKLVHAKKIIKDALIGLVIVISAATLTAIMTHAYGSPAQNVAQHLPNLGHVKPSSASFSLVDVIVKAITGLLSYLIQSIGSPIINALSYFTKGTPLMVSSPGVFKMWLGVLGISDSLFVLVLALVGFHVMSASSLGIGELSLRHLAPRIALTFVLINSSIFAVDALISLSNVMIAAIYAGFGQLNVWSVLSAIAGQSGLTGLAALLIMMVFLVIAFILLVYYVGRLVTLYLGAVLAPLVILLWLLPSFSDFATSAIKSYIATIFVLFIHVIILILAGSLLSSLIAGNSDPNPIMSLVVGISTLVALLKTQGVMMQLNYASIGPKSLKRLSSQLMNGISHSVRV